MLLRRFSGLQDRLAAAMEAGTSVGGCVRLIERELEGNVADLISAEEVNTSANFVGSSSSAATTAASSSSSSTESSTQEAP
jgi:hypothetical protein